MDLTGLVLHDGVLVRAVGRVLVIDGTAWFERPLPRLAIRTSPPRPPRQGPYAVRAHGVDVHRIEGAISGWTILIGTWRGHELHVRDQTTMPQGAGRTDRWTTPPCPPPAAGWPTAPIYGGMSTANLPVRPPQPAEQAELAITQVTVFYPHPTQPVLVVAAEDPDRVERALRPTFGHALCVVPSRYSRAEVDRTLRQLRERKASRHWPVSSSGRSAGEDGQATVTAKFAWIEPEVAEWAATVPDGLLDLDVWLTPADQAHRVRRGRRPRAG